MMFNGKLLYKSDRFSYENAFIYICVSSNIPFLLCYAILIGLLVINMFLWIFPFNLHIQMNEMVSHTDKH